MIIRKTLSILVIFALLITFLLPLNQIGYAQTSEPFSDLKQSWAREQLTDWLNKGLITGYSDKTIKPNEKISRAEFVTLINRVFGYKEITNNNFIDVSHDAWYYDQIGIAKQADYISGYNDGTFKPKQEITRQEVAKIIFILMKLEKTENEDPLTIFSDKDKIHNCSLDYVNAVVDKGYMNGYKDNTFKPGQSITRAEAVVLLDRVTGSLINKQGSYGDYLESSEFEGNVFINTDNVTLNNILIKGDLYLAPGIGEGEVYLNDVIVEGRTIVAGGGENSVIFNNSTIHEIIIDKALGRVRVLTKGNTEIFKVIVKTGAKLEDSSQGVGFQNVLIQSTNHNDRIDLIGQFGNVSILNSTRVNILEDTTIESIEVSDKAEGTEIYTEDGSEIETITLNAAVFVRGNGIIHFAFINTDGSSFEQVIEDYQLSDSVTLVIIAETEVTENPTEEEPTPAPASSPTPAPAPTPQPEQPEPVVLPEVEGLFIVGDKLYSIFTTIGDYSNISWTLDSTVTDSVYGTVTEAVYSSANYIDSNQYYGIYTISDGYIPGAIYTVTADGYSDVYEGIMLSQKNVSDAVYGYVYYGGTESLSFNIDNLYEITDLSHQLPVEASPLVQDNVMTIFYGGNLILEASWNSLENTWNFQEFRNSMNPPVNLTAQTISNTAIGLSWEPVEDAEYYYVYYSNSLYGDYVPITDNTGEKKQILLPNEGYYIDDSNLPHTTRYYKVTAANSLTESDFSNTVSATTYYNYHINLDFEITDIVEHPTEPIIYITDKANNQLHAVNYSTEAISSITFDLPPERVTYANGELFVTLLHGEHSSYWFDNQSGTIVILDPTTLTITETFDITIDPYDIVVDQNGNIYVSSGSGQWTYIKSYSRDYLTEIETKDIRQQSYIHIHPFLNKIYTITTDSSPRDISAYNVLSGSFIEDYDSPYHGDYSMNTNLLISPDGQYLFNGAGTVFKSRDSKYDDMRYVYSLNSSFTDAAFDLNNNRIYTAKNNQINVYNYDNFEQTGLYHTDGTAAWIFNDTVQILVVSDLNGSNIIEVVEKSSMEAVPPSVSTGVEFDGRIVDVLVNPSNNQMYAIDEAFNNLYTVDLGSQSIINTLKLPYTPSGLGLSEDNTKLYIVNDDEHNLATEINLSDYTITRHVNYTSSPDSRDFSTRHIYSRGNKLYVVLGDWEPTLLIFDQTTFEQVIYSPAILGVGEMAFSNDNTKFYYWYQYGWDAGNAGSDVYAYSIGTTYTKIDESQIGYPDMKRDPLDTPVLLLEDLGIVIVKDKVFNSNDLLQLIHTFPESIYAVNVSENIAVGKNGVYDLSTYQLVESLSLDVAKEMFFDNNGNFYYIEDNTLYLKQ